MLTEAQKRIAKLLDLDPDTVDAQAIEIIDDCLTYEAKGPLQLATHIVWVLKNRF